jgi:hypothetical protein
MSTNKYKQVQTSTNKYKQVQTGTNGYKRVQTSTNEHKQVKQVQTSTTCLRHWPGVLFQNGPY